MSDREKFERAATETITKWRDIGPAYLPHHFQQLAVIFADAIEKAVAEKQAEIDRLNASHAALANRINELLIEIDRLKSSTDPLLKQIDRLKAEMERVTGERDKANDEWISAVGRSNAALLKAAATEHTLKEELERLTGERDTWRKRFEAQPSTYQLAAVEQERDTIREELEAERRGWPIEQPLTDMPMERQIKLLNQQLVEQQMERDTLRAQLEEALTLMAAKAQVFRNYEALHLAKLTDAGMLKAKENRNHASDLEAFIQRVKQTS